MKTHIILISNESPVVTWQDGQIAEVVPQRGPYSLYVRWRCDRLKQESFN